MFHLASIILNEYLEYLAAYPAVSDALSFSVYTHHLLLSSQPLFIYTPQDNYGVDSYDSELSSSSYDMYPQESASSSEDWMDSEDEIADSSNNKNNMFITLDNNNPNCDGIGPNTCDNRIACVWECKTRFGSDRDRGCCVRRSDFGRPNFQPSPPSRPSSPTRRPSRPTRRPSSNGGTSFDSGLRQGRREAQDIWYDLGSSCASAWSEFRDSVNRRISNNGWNSLGNWRTRSYNRGARAGMNEVVTEKEKECFHDSADECVDLGNEAARILAYDYCETNSGPGMVNVKEWRRECRDAAVDQCRGQMFSQVRSECGSPNTSDLRDLQSKCWNQVLTMIGDRSEE